MARAAFAPVARAFANINAVDSIAGDRGWYRIMDRYPGGWQQDVEVNYSAVDSYWANFACYTLIASDIAKMPINVMEYDAQQLIWKKTKRRPVIQKPNHYQTRIEFVFCWMVSQLRHGNTYALKLRDEKGFVKALYILDPCFVTPLVTSDGGVYYRVDADKLGHLNAVPKEGLIIPATEIIHDRMYPIYHPLVGLSPIFACAAQAMQGSSIINTSTGFFANRGLPAGVLTAPARISDDTAQRLKTYFDDNFTGRNAGKIAVLGDGLKFESLESKAADSQMIQQLKMTGEMIAACYHVPGYKIGVGQMPTVNNVAALNQQYYDQCLHFLVEKFEARLDEGLELDDINQCWLDTSALMRMDPQMRSQVLGTKVKDAILSPNEARREDDLPPVEGGDAPLMQVQNYSLAALARRDEADKAKQSAPPVIGGAQLTNVQSLLTAVMDGKLPVDTARVLISSAVPSLTEAQVAAMLAPIEEALENSDEDSDGTDAPDDLPDTDDLPGDTDDTSEDDEDLETLGMVMQQKLLAEVSSWQ
jgi:HK97 family phage portal protein